MWTDHPTSDEALAARLQATDVLVLFRERTQIQAPLLALLPPGRLRLVSLRSAYAHVDVRVRARSSSNGGSSKPALKPKT